MPFAPSNGIELCYDTAGDPADPALLLVNGFTAQMIGWDDDLCAALADRGRYVIRFDNRDCGLSTHLDGVAVDLPAVLAASLGKGEMPDVPYTLSTFADDAFGLLDHLGIEQAHIVGASMGGMIVQTMAIERPERVTTLTSIMSTSGELDYFTASPEALKSLFAPAPEERQAYIDYSAQTAQIYCSPRYFDAELAKRKAAASFDRAFYPEGGPRQLAAIRASGHRADGLRKLEVPTLVVHGRADTLIEPSGGERTAELVPAANLLMLNDMGHDLPRPLWPLIVDAIVSHTTHAIA